MFVQFELLLQWTLTCGIWIIGYLSCWAFNYFDNLSETHQIIFITKIDLLELSFP